jgi:hypothetical protein
VQGFSKILKTTKLLTKTHVQSDLYGTYVNQDKFAMVFLIIKRMVSHSFRRDKIFDWFNYIQDLQKHNKTN